MPSLVGNFAFKFKSNATNSQGRTPGKEYIVLGYNEKSEKLLFSDDSNNIATVELHNVLFSRLVSASDLLSSAPEIKAVNYAPTVIPNNITDEINKLKRQLGYWKKRAQKDNPDLEEDNAEDAE